MTTVYLSIPDSIFEQNFAFFNNFFVKKSVRVISSLYRRHNLVACHYQLGGKILTAFIRCLVIYVKLSPGISQTIGRSAVIQEEDPILRALCNYFG